MYGLAEKYYDQRIGFINQHFEILEKELNEYISRFNNLAKGIVKELTENTFGSEGTMNCVNAQLDKSLCLVSSFDNAIVSYTQKIDFKIRPKDYDKNPNQLNAIGLFEHWLNQLQQIIKNAHYEKINRQGFDYYECTKSKEIFKALDELNSLLPAVLNHMIKFTQNEREQVFPDVLAIMAKYSTLPQAIVQPSPEDKPTVSNSPTLFGK